MNTERVHRGKNVTDEADPRKSSVGQQSSNGSNAPLRELMIGKWVGDEDDMHCAMYNLPCMFLIYLPAYSNYQSEI